MKKNSFILFVLCSIIFYPSFLQANTKIKVVTENLPPYNYPEDGDIKGVSTELVKEVLKRAGIEAEFSCYPWARSYNKAQREANVLIYSIVKTKEREKMFKWISVLIPYEASLFKLKVRSDIQLKSLEEAKKYRIGGIIDDVKAQFLESKGFAKGNLFLVSRNEENVVLLFKKRIDLVAFDDLTAKDIVSKAGYDFSLVEEAFQLPFDGADLYMAFSLKTSDELVERCKKAFDSIVEDGTYQKIRKKYF